MATDSGDVMLYLATMSFTGIFTYWSADYGMFPFHSVGGVRTAA